MITVFSKTAKAFLHVFEKFLEIGICEDFCYRHGRLERVDKMVRIYGEKPENS